MSSFRSPAVAGTFYPGDHLELAAMLGSLLKSATSKRKYLKHPPHTNHPLSPAGLVLKPG